MYEKGDKVRLVDDSVATVVTVKRGQYTLPEGQSLGGQPGAQTGGEASYTVRTAKGKVIEVQDRDVRNVPKTETKARKRS
ncbi:MAG: hypothetical protein H0V56_08915 [Chthoniobacterales bacterium]|nr:hypothetical protein [Chthoniobacterales bacterium]